MSSHYIFFVFLFFFKYCRVSIYFDKINFYFFKREYGGGRIVSTGSDGLVKVWTGNLDLLAEFDLTVHGTVHHVGTCVRWCPGTIPRDVKRDLSLPRSD